MRIKIALLQHFYIRYVFVLIFSLVFGGCTYFYTIIDQKVLDNIDRYEQLYNSISASNKIGTKRIFRNAEQLRQFSQDCNNCDSSEIASELYKEGIFFGFNYVKEDKMFFYLKKIRTWYQESYTHTLIFSPNEIPVFNNSEGDTQFELIKQQKIGEHWYYDIMAYYN